MQVCKKILLTCLALLTISVSLTGCAGEMEKPVASFGDYDVLYEELRYLVLTQKDIMKSTYGDTIFDTAESAEAYRAELEATVIEKLKGNYTVLAACNHYLPGLKIDDDVVQNAVDDLIEDAAEEAGGEDTFFEMSEGYYITENFFRFTTAVSIMEDLLRQELAIRAEIENFFSDTELGAFSDWIKAGNGVYVQHIFIRNDLGEKVEDNRALAQDTKEKLESGSLAIGDIVGTALNQELQYLNPYYLVKDIYAPALEEAALSLTNVGDVSPVVETDEGFYIFVRIDDPEGINLSQNISSLLYSHQWARTESIVQAFRGSVTFEWTSFGKELDWLTIQ